MAVKAGEGHDADVPGAGEQPADVRTGQRHRRADLRRHHRSPIGAVVPRQQVTRQPICERQQQQDHAHDPRASRGFL